jgi:uncharacterized protein (TIGR02145 family)
MEEFILWFKKLSIVELIGVISGIITIGGLILWILKKRNIIFNYFKQILSKIVNKLEALYNFICAVFKQIFGKIRSLICGVCKWFKIIFTINKLEARIVEMHKEIKSLKFSIPMTPFTDHRDGKTYKTVKIGEQTWLAENLNFECEGSKCYCNNPSNADKYGRLYDWETAMKICPEGWHLPSKSEYEVLDKIIGGKKVAGTKLKAASGWNSDGNGTDDYGFSALPGGLGNSSGGFGCVGNRGNWWSASEDDCNSKYSYSRLMFYNTRSTYWDILDKSLFLSLRCVRD